MTQTVNDALAQAHIISDDARYRFVHLPPNAITVAAGIVAEWGDPFAALLVDKAEVTLMLPDDALTEFERRLVDHEVSQTRYRLITFDVVLDAGLVGFMARISAALAAAGISILPYAAYQRDHIFVAEADFDAAMQTLRQLQSQTNA